MLESNAGFEYCILGKRNPAILQILSVSTKQGQKSIVAISRLVIFANEMKQALH